MSFAEEIAIGDRLLGQGRPCLIVAEIGINHNGDMALAKEAICAAVDAGADSVKFQNYRTEDFVSDRSQTYTYENGGRKIVESQYDMFKRCELDKKKFAELKSYCDAKGIDCHSTPTGLDGLADLIDVDVKVLKNGSDYLCNLPLIKAMGESGLPVVLSTGMATKNEIEAAVNIFSATGNRNLILLHCVSLYPAPKECLNLRQICSLRNDFKCLVGYSDHSVGNEATLLAVSLGASWIEKHFTLDKTLPGPDHRFSANPDEFRDLVKWIRLAETMLGTGEIGYCEEEKNNREAYRLSCVAARDLSKDHVIIESDLLFQRPGNGVSPSESYRLIGKRLKKKIFANQQINIEDIE